MSNEESVRPELLPAVPVERHGPFARIVMVAAGGTFAAAFFRVQARWSAC